MNVTVLHPSFNLLELKIVYDTLTLMQECKVMIEEVVMRHIPL
jgi:hypothetical protein